MSNLAVVLRRLSIRPNQPYLSLLRSLSSNSDPPPSIKAVSYPVKPKEPTDDADGAAAVSDSGNGDENAPPSASPPPSPPPPRRHPDAAARQWTREEIRFVKDAPVISPVSYPSKVAPLPEDRSGEDKDGSDSGRGPEERRGGDEQLRKEARWIERDARQRTYFQMQAVEEVIPFPTLIQHEKRPPKVPMDLQEAIREVKANSGKVKRKFHETVEAHVNLGVDPRRSDQTVRGALTLPHGTGKTVRVAVFAEGTAAEDARAAGADVVGGDNLIEEIKNGGGKLNFDKCIATPMFMPRLSKIARILGPRGLMPNPKLGSVTSDVSGAVKEVKSGRIDFKIDKTAIVHVGLGKVNFSDDALRENIGAFVNALLVAKPVGLKKTSKYAGYVNSFSLCSTMGPSFRVSIQSLSNAADHYNKLHGK